MKIVLNMYLHGVRQIEFSCVTYTRVGQNNRNTTDTIHIFVINMILDYLLLSVQLQSFWEWTRTGFEQSLAQFYTILEEHRGTR
jgi:hypothetical protein